MKPGVYQICYRGLTLAETWRFSGEPIRFLIALVLKLIGFKGAMQRLPAHEVEVQCREDDLSEDAAAALAPVARRARELGYANGRFYTLREYLDPAITEAASYLGFHQDRTRILFIGYANTESKGTSEAKMTITGWLVTTDHHYVGFVDHRNYLDGLPTSRMIRVKGKGIDAVHQAMTDYASGKKVRMFGSFDEMKRSSQEHDVNSFDAMIARGLYVLKEEAPVR